MLWYRDPLAEPDEPPFEAVLRISEHPVGKKARPVWLEREDGERWLVAYQPDPCWLALDGQLVRVHGRRYEPALQALSAVHFRVSALSCAGTDAPFVEVGPECTLTGTIECIHGTPGSKSAGSSWLVFAPDDGSASYQLVNPELVEAPVGDTVVVVARPVALSPYTAHRSGRWLCLLESDRS